MQPATVEVTVAVPVKDRREQMLACLDALLAQDHPSYEILVLDNESSDGTAEACSERAAGASVPVRVVTLQGSVGHIRNRAAELARGEILAFTDSDCVPTPGWLTAGTRPFATDAKLGVVCGQTLPQEELVDVWPATIEVTELSGRYESCNVLFRRDAFAATNGFDEIVGHFWEDTAAGLALKRAGWTAAFAPDAVVHHDVTYPGFWWHVRRMRRHSNAGRVLREYPEARELLYMRVFVVDRDAPFLLALLGLGLALARRKPLPLVLAIPYARLFKPPHDWRAITQRVIWDGARVAAAAEGGIRWRRFVL